MSEEGKKKTADKSGDKKSNLSPEVKRLFDVVYKHHDTVEKSVEEMIAAMGMSVEEMKDYLNNPNNFSPAQWKMIQEGMARLEGELKLNLNLDQGPKKKTATAQKAEEKKADQKRKGKTLGARRNWISM